MPDQKKRPTLDETLARLDAVLAEPAPCPLDDHHLQVVTRHLERVASPPATEDQAATFRAVGDAIDDAVRRGLLARAIGWFRR